jgi:hypothetical protein
VAQDTRDTPSEVYRTLNSPRKPSVGYERHKEEPKGAGSRILGRLSTAVAILALLGIAYWALSRPQASLPDRMGRYPRMENQTELEERTTTQYQAGTKGDVRVAVYGNKQDRVILALFVDEGSPSLDAFATKEVGPNAAVLQDPKVFAALRRGGGTVRCVTGGVPTPYLSQCIWQEGGTFAILTSTEPTAPGALKLAVQSHEAAITSRIDGFLGTFIPSGARATVPRS